MRLPARAAAWAGARRQTAWMDEFIPAARWDGARNDFVFKTGELGTGYYRDIPAAAPAAALAVSSDDAQLQAELDQLGLAAPRSAEPASEQDSEVFDELRGASKPQELAHRAKAAFQAAELLARGDGDAACAPQSSEVLVPAGLKDCSTGGATGGRDCPHPDALAKYKECVTLYTDALQHRPMEVGDPDLSSEDRSNYFSSRAEARIRLAQFRAAVHDCDFAIALSPASVTQATAEKRKRRAASMAAQFSKRAEETANNTLTSAAETIKQNKDLAKELSELDPETAKGGLKSMTLMAAVTKLKNRGNEAFGAQQWATAAGDYHAAIRVIALAQEEARRERDAEREAHLALDGDDYMSEMIETVEVKEAWPGEALNLRNLHGNLAAALLGLVRDCSQISSHGQPVSNFVQP